MNVVLFGATGKAGTRIQHELLSRGHAVTSIARDPSKLAPAEGLTVAKGDMTKDDLAPLMQGADAVITSYGPPADKPQEIVSVTHRLVDAVKKSGVARLLMVGGAGSLEVTPGKQLIDTPDFPEAWKGIAGAHRDALDVLKKSDINWTNLSPGAFFAPGERTGKFRLGTDELIANEAGESKISMEDYAIALVNELESGIRERTRFSIGY